MTENDFLKWIAGRAGTHGSVVLNIGDDMAAVRMKGVDPLALLKIDQCLDLVHFDLREHSAQQAGRKAVNRCLSDCAAMACLPAAVMLSVAFPLEGPGSGEAFAKELFLACQEAAGKFDCPLVGGDTTFWDQRLVITVAGLGAAKGGRLVPRGGAKVGHTVLVPGALGGSILGRHLSFVPRIELGQKLLAAAGEGLHAMMDLSDGLFQDVPRMAEASGVGMEIYAARLPVHEDAYVLAERDGVPAGLHALADGEDYELLFAVDPEVVPEIVNLTEVPVTAIGVVTEEGEGLKLVDGEGRRTGWPGSK